MPARRGTTDRNSRGNATDRRARKQWLLDEFGDGKTAACAFDCGTMVDIDTIYVDRHPVPGCLGGRYVRTNIRPSCGSCNSRFGATLRSTP